MAIETIQELFESRITGKVNDKPELKEQIGAAFKFDVTGGQAATWVVDLAAGTVSQGDGDAQCTVTVADTDLLDIINGNTTAEMAFMAGKVKVSDVALAMKLGALLS